MVSGKRRNRNWTQDTRVVDLHRAVHPKLSGNDRLDVLSRCLDFGLRRYPAGPVGAAARTTAAAAARQQVGGDNLK